MLRFFLIALLALPTVAGAQGRADVINTIANEHILDGFDQLAQKSQALALTAQKTCNPTDSDLRGDYVQAFDAWIKVSHFRFGPTEENNRAFAMGFWPDNRGKTPKVLRKLISTSDPVANSIADYSDVSIAARGFYALEFLLYDPAFSAIGQPGYRCQLLRTITDDIAKTTHDLNTGWQAYGENLKSTGPDGIYRAEDEVLRELLKAASTGLQFTSETRLGRPLGSFERPRPKRAEARRSGRSLNNVVAATEAATELAITLAQNDPKVANTLNTALERFHDIASGLNDPVFAGVSNPQGRIRIEALQHSLNQIRAIVDQQLGPALGVTAGFNSLDGD